MVQRKASIPLRDAIPMLIPSEKWTALLAVVGGSVDNAVRSLSGDLAGRLFLDAEIVASPIAIGVDSERRRLREFEKLRVETVNCLEVKRRDGDWVLQGYPPASPAKPVKISSDLALECHFSNGTVRSGELTFYGVTVQMRTEAPATVGVSPPSKDVSQAALKNFCKKRLADRSPEPAMDVLWDEAKKEFPNNHVARERVRKLHQELIPPHFRRPGPRK